MSELTLNNRSSSIVGYDRQLNKRLRAADRDGKLAERLLEIEAELAEFKLNYKGVLSVVAMQAYIKVINARRALAEDDPYIDSKLRGLEDTFGLSSKCLVLNAFD